MARYGNDERNILCPGFDLKEFGRRVRFMRKKLGKSQEWLAEQLDISRTQIDNIEKGKRSTSIENVLLLSQVLHTTPNYLLATDYSDEPDGEWLTLRDRITAQLDGRSCADLENIEALIGIYCDGVDSSRKALRK